MLLEKYSTNAVVAKIRAMYGKMLTIDNYNEMLSKQSVAEVAAYLKANTHYGDILSSVDTSTIHRGFLETLIRRNNFNIYKKLFKFQGLDKEGFYRYEIISDEMQYILSSILHINSGGQENFIKTVPGFIIEHSKIDFIKLAKASTFSKLLDVLKDTDYYEIISDVNVDDDGKVDYMRSEILLRTYFYRTMLETINKEYSGKIVSTLEKNIKTQIDLINMINAYRMKAYFSADSAEIKGAMLPFYGQMSKKKMYHFYEAKDKDTMLNIIDSSRYAKQINILDEEFAEHGFFVIRYKNAKRALRNAGAAPVAFYSFMYLCEVEAINIISITEGIRYNASPSYIEKLLIV